MQDLIDPLQAMPASIIIEVSSRCNLRCCYCHKANDALEALPGANDDMTEDHIAALYRHCKALGIKSVSLSMGGETTVVAGWQHRIAQFLDDPAIETHMVSNFARPFGDDELAALTKFNALQISFDSADPAMVRNLRSKADLHKITRNIERLKETGRRLGRCPYLVVNCVLCRDNIGHVQKLAELCRELAVDQLLLTEVMLTTRHAGMPETLDALTEDEVLLLAEQIIRAEDALRDSETGLRLRDHLQARIGEIVEQLREGMRPADAAGYFHRRATASACRQPWESPLVDATGKVIACCGAASVDPIGSLSAQTMSEIMDGAAARRIRASILEGHPIVACRTCSYAQGGDFAEFARQIRELQGDTDLPPLDAEYHATPWPGLLGSVDYRVTVENSRLTVDGHGTGSLVEDPSNGYHRVLIDVAPGEYSEVRFKVRPAGRRRLRFDCCEEKTPVARAHLLLSRQPRIASPIGSMGYWVTPAGDRWYEVRAKFPAPQPMSEITLFLMREDEAVRYGGDGRSGLDIAGLSII